MLLREAVQDESQHDGSRALRIPREFTWHLIRLIRQAVITDTADDPKLVLETDRYLREVLAGRTDVDVYAYCHRPIVVTDPKATLDHVLDQFVVEAHHGDDLVVDRDVVLYWTDDARRIVTGADILGRLLQGIASRATPRSEETDGPA